MDIDNNYECEFCGISFEKFQQKANHIRWEHKKYSFSEKGLESLKKKVSLNNDKRFGIIIKEVVPCLKCGKEIEIEYREKKGKKEKNFCSLHCSQARIQTPEIRRKVSKSVSKSLKEKWANDDVYRDKCLNQAKQFSSKSERTLVKYFKETFVDDEWTNGGNIQYNGIQLARDLYSKKLKVNIEVDGIWHFKDIHGQLKDKQMKDKTLNKWSKENGWRIIRIKEDYLSSNRKDEFYQKIIDAVYKLNDNYVELY